MKLIKIVVVGCVVLIMESCSKYFPLFSIKSRRKSPLSLNLQNVLLSNYIFLKNVVRQEKPRSKRKTFYLTFYKEPIIINR